MKKYVLYTAKCDKLKSTKMGRVLVHGQRSLQ
jgi:hypothetical protein